VSEQFYDILALYVKRVLFSLFVATRYNAVCWFSIYVFDKLSGRSRG